MLVVLQSMDCKSHRDNLAQMCPTCPAAAKMKFRLYTKVGCGVFALALNSCHSDQDLCSASYSRVRRELIEVALHTTPY